MTTREYLYMTMQEECAEVAKAASKCARFGEDIIAYEDSQRGTVTNINHFFNELEDLWAVLELLDEQNGEEEPEGSPTLSLERIAEHKQQIQNMLYLARENGRVTDNPEPYMGPDRDQI